MEIKRVSPPPPPAQFSLTFPRDDGWTIVAALFEYVDRHKGAVDREVWRGWAKDLDKELRQGL